MIHDKKIGFRLVFLFLMLISFYLVGFPLELIILLGAISLAFLVFRGSIKEKLNGLMHLHIPGFGNLHPWARAALLFIVFLLVYMVLKQILYFALYLFGFDIQGMTQNAIDKLQ
jgi:hypothetical protein